ncbi:hypothetical protein COP2_002737 [Malus domestica]
MPILAWVSGRATVREGEISEIQNEKTVLCNTIDDFDVGFVRSISSIFTSPSVRSPRRPIVLPISVNLGFLQVYGLLSRVWERKGASLVRHLRSIISIGRTTWR